MFKSSITEKQLDLQQISRNFMNFFIKVKTVKLQGWNNDGEKKE